MLPLTITVLVQVLPAIEYNPVHTTNLRYGNAIIRHTCGYQWQQDDFVPVI